MDSHFVDLDLLLTKVKEPRTRTYFLEAVRSYKAGALRAAIASAWVSVVYDLIAKYRELSAMGDAGATAFLQKWEAATNSGDVKKLLELERDILRDAVNVTQLVGQVAHRQLERLRDDRHLCAHPAFSTEADLFEPSPEMARLHLVNAIDLVLSQEPLVGKAISQQFDADVQSTGFPTAEPLILDYVEQRYLTRIRPPAIKNFGIVLVKSLLLGVPPTWDTLHRKIVPSLVAVRDRASSAWPDVAATAVRLIDNLPPSQRHRAIAFLAGFPAIWDLLAPATKTALAATATNIDPVTLSDYRIFAGIRLPQFQAPLTNALSSLSRAQLSGAVAASPLLELWPSALATYKSSGGFRTSEANFRDLIAPFQGLLGTEQFNALLDAITDNGQNWDAGGTPELLLSLLRAAAVSSYPARTARDEFYRLMKHYGGVDRFEEVVRLFHSDGWMPPETSAE